MEVRFPNQSKVKKINCGDIIKKDGGIGGIYLVATTCDCGYKQVQLINLNGLGFYGEPDTLQRVQDRVDRDFGNYSLFSADEYALNVTEK